MAHLEKIERDDGKVTWLVRWREADGTQRKKTHRRKLDADRHLKSLEHAMATGDYVSPDLGKVTVGEWAQTWIDAQAHLKPSTRHRYERLIAVQILPAWGSTPLSAVTHLAVKTWVTKLSKTLAPSTVRQAHRVLYMALALAVSDNRLARNPAAKVKTPRVGQADKRFLTHAQVRALADAIGHPYRVAVLVMAYCGLRFGELAALKVRRVDVNRRRLEVAESVTDVNGVLEWTDTKNHGRRSVPIPPFVVDELAALVEGRDGEELVFGSPRGGVLRNQNFRRDAFDEAAAAAGLGGLTPHELRHTAASLAVAAGANVKALQRLLGHASAAMTLDVYSGLFDDDLDDVADRLAQGWEDAA